MKLAITFVVCIALGISIGFFYGQMRSAADSAAMRSEIRDYMSKLNVTLAALDKLRAEESQAAEPSMASSASIALAALKSLDVNDMQSAKVRLAAIIAIYYRNHLRDGDTNLIASIETFATTDTVLSNALHSKFP